MRRRKPASDENQSYDSFLDIVANLVGILVILIMVIGVRARNALQLASDGDSTHPVTTVAAPAEPAESHAVVATNETVKTIDDEDLSRRQAVTEKLAVTRVEVSNLQRSTRELETRMQEIAEVGYQKAIERDHLQALVVAAEHELDEKKRKLTDDQQRQLEAQQKVRDAETHLTEVEQQLSAVRTTVGSAQTLEHYPTPLAQTVFGHEEHFRLQHGRICYVPINEIVDVLQNDAQNKVWKLKETSEVTETIGPFDGFHVRYTMQRQDRRIPTPEGAVLRTTVSLKRFTLLPLREVLGEPIAQAMRPDSEFQRRLQQLIPADTTVTIWTYPDSYNDFRGVKHHLLERGFLAAARPLPDGFPISGSPEGSRSLAE